MNDCTHFTTYNNKCTMKIEQTGRKAVMWKNVNGKLIHVTDTTRVKCRTNISQTVLDKLSILAKKNNTHVNYLIENGLENLLAIGSIDFDKEQRPKDRVQYKTTYDKDLLAALKEFAKLNKLFMNDVIEASINFIDLSHIKDRNYQHRIE